MIFQDLFIPVAIFVVLYIAYFILRKKLRKYKGYAILLNCVGIVLCLVLIIDAIKNGRNAFILFLLLLLGISVKRLIDETKKRRLS
jgi:uncharacterized membrane protein YoaK (UPF0700 family)